MECVILFRYPNGRVDFISGQNEVEPSAIAVFPDRDAANEAAQRVPVCKAFPFQIVELDEI